MKKTGKVQVQLSIRIRSQTWQRDSHNLFDYESNIIVSSTVQCNQNCAVVGFEDKVLLLADELVGYQNQYRPLVKIDLVQQESPQFYVKPMENDTLWLIARNQLLADRSQGYVLKQGDIIKLGRVKFRIIEVQNGQSDYVIDSNVRQSYPICNPEQTPCRICFDCTDTTTNPLISPCECSGSMQTIHLICLQRWINSRMERRFNGHIVTFSWPSMDCEVCKTSYPYRILHDQTLYSCFQTNVDGLPCIVLEAISHDRHKRRGIYKIRFNQSTTAFMGRSHDSDVRITDISVSRTHALIQFAREQFILKDNASKFGTLIMANQDIALNEDEVLALQIGRTVLYLEIINNPLPNKAFLMESSMDQDDTQTPDLSY